MADAEENGAPDMDALKRQMAYPLVKNCDMNEEMKNEAVDLVSTAVEKHAGNYELAARMIKETMDKKCASFANLGVPCASYLYPFTLQLLPGPPPP